MSEIIRATLIALKDVQGVQGGFVLAGNGSLVAMEMPPLFDAEMFRELGPRIERFSESFASLGDELESCIVRYTDHILCVKRFAKGGALCVLAVSPVNLPALKMAMNLADKRLAGQVNGTGLAPGVAAYPMTTVGAASPPANAPAVPAPPAVAPEPARKIPRYYRGHLVED